MSISQFEELCEEVFVRRRAFPTGCEECKSTIEWDCYHYDPVTKKHEYCPWRENYWKYDELKRYRMLVRAGHGGFDVNRLRSLRFNDYVKIGVMKHYLQGNL